MFCLKCGNECVEGSIFCNNCGEKIVMENDKKCKCCICRSNEIRDNSPILFVGEDGDYKELCDNCALKMESFEKNDFKARAYFKNILPHIIDKDVKIYIEQLLSDSDEQGVSKNVREMNAAETGNSKSIWVVGLKFIAWLVFFAIIILGIVVAINADEEVGFLFFLASVPIAFFTVAGIMIYLDIAADIREIKNELLSRK